MGSVRLPGSLHHKFRIFKCYLVKAFRTVRATQVNSTNQMGLLFTLEAEWFTFSSIVVTNKNFIVCSIMSGEIQHLSIALYPLVHPHALSGIPALTFWTKLWPLKYKPVKKLLIFARGQEMLNPVLSKNQVLCPPIRMILCLRGEYFQRINPTGTTTSKLCDLELLFIN